MSKPDLFGAGGEAPAPPPGPDIHWHRCCCGFRWGHSEDKAGSIPHHRCRECGAMVWSQDGEYEPALGAAKSRGNIIICDGPKEYPEWESGEI